MVIREERLFVISILGTPAITLMAWKLICRYRTVVAYTVAYIIG